MESSERAVQQWKKSSKRRGRVKINSISGSGICSECSTFAEIFRVCYSLFTYALCCAIVGTFFLSSLFCSPQRGKWNIWAVVEFAYFFHRQRSRTFNILSLVSRKVWLKSSNWRVMKNPIRVFRTKKMRIFHLFRLNLLNVMENSKLFCIKVTKIKSGSYDVVHFEGDDKKRGVEVFLLDDDDNAKKIWMENFSIFHIISTHPRCHHWTEKRKASKKIFPHTKSTICWLNQNVEDFDFVLTFCVCSKNFSDLISNKIANIFQFYLHFSALSAIEFDADLTSSLHTIHKRWWKKFVNAEDKFFPFLVHSCKWTSGFWHSPFFYDIKWNIASTFTVDSNLCYRMC